ncbi:uncharacterized protein LOC141588125 [Silene latifolia]|uniref:uncharacterized protein LOC141588125 n=1 Tax=Silene latifolia TaxID=37657 RepID=UPI003D76A6A4
MLDGWCVTTNSSLHKGGRVWILWKPNLFDVMVCQYDAQFIHTRVTTRISQQQFWFTMVYAYNDGIGRRDLWQKFEIIAGQCSGAWAWALAGDFNIVIDPNERLGANTRQADMDEFLDCIATCGVTDIAATGAYYTWTNKQEPLTRVFSRLDRGGRRASFKYYNMWGKADDFIPTVTEQWNKNYPGHKMFAVIKKLKALKPALKALNRSCYPDIVNNTLIAETRLQDLQKQLATDIHNTELMQKESQAAADLKKLSVARDSFLSQKAKSQWLEEGDSNTAYFHGAIKKRISMNKVI